MACTGCRQRWTRPLKILLTLSSLGVGGAERAASMLASCWATSGHNVTLMPTYSDNEPQRAFALAPEVRVRPLAAEMAGRTTWPAKIAALRRIILAEQYDVVCSFLPNVNITAISAAFGTNTPVVVSERTFPPQFPLGPVLETLRRLLYPRAAAIVMQTDEGLDWLKSRFPNCNALAIPNPVVQPLPNSEPVLDPDTFLDPHRRNLIAVGRLSSEKQFDLLIEAFCDVRPRHPEWDLTIVGDGPERTALEALVRKRDASHFVRLPGKAGNMHDWYLLADAFAMVSRFEGFPNALAEAMSYGLPSLAIDCATGPRDMISDQVDGILLPRGSDPWTLRDGLDRHLSQTWNIPQTRVDAFKRRFDLKTISDAWLSCFEEAIRERRP